MAQRTKGQGRKPAPRSRRPASLADLMRAIAAEPVEVTADAEGEELPPSASSRQEQLVRALWARAMDGDLAAARLLIEYMEGKPVQRVAANVGAGVQLVPRADDFAAAQGRLEQKARELAARGASGEGGAAGDD